MNPTDTKNSPPENKDNSGNEKNRNTIERIVWFALAGALIAAIGICILMTWHHESQLYGGGDGKLIGCESTEKTNCNVVNTSPYSTMFGIPIATWGIPIYALALYWTIMIINNQRRFNKLLLPMGVMTTGYSIFLYFISINVLEFVCAWCMRLYVINVAIILVSLSQWGHLKTIFSTKLLNKDIQFSGLILVGTTIMAIGSQQFYHQSLTKDSSHIDDSFLAKKKEAANKKVKDNFDEGGHFIDPEGELPSYSVDVKTETGEEATLTLMSTDPWKGSLDAKVVIVEFADFQCPYCKRMASQLSELYDAYKADALFVYKHFPIDKQCNAGVKSRKHKKACAAALASVCAQEQDRFWAYHDTLYKNQHAIEKEDLQLYAKRMGLDMQKFNSCLSNKASRKQMQEDTEMGKTLEIRGTPRLFINGKLYRSGTSTQQLALAIEKALGSKEAVQNARAFVKANVVYQAIPSDITEQSNQKYDDLSFKIDTFEAALKDGVATIGKHEIPATRMSWYAAKSACEKAGKRLCSEQEWVSACQNAKAVDDDNDGEFADDMVEGTSYTYGEQHDPKRCWTAKRGQNQQGETYRPVYTGEMPGCGNNTQVYDLIGNVSEWVGATEKEAVLLGGAFDTPKDKARCYRRNDTYGPGYANQRTGFRCCSNAE